MAADAILVVSSKRAVQTPGDPQNVVTRDTFTTPKTLHREIVMSGYPMFMFPIAIVITLLFGAWLIFVYYDDVKEAMEEGLIRRGFEIVEMDVSTSSKLGGAFGHFAQFTVRLPGNPRLFKGQGRLRGKRLTIEWLDDMPPGASAAPVRSTTDQSARVEAEVEARLKKIVQTPGSVAEFDLDGSGHVDNEEWERLKARVRAEVEFDFDAERRRAAEQRAPGSNQSGSSW